MAAADAAVSRSVWRDVVGTIVATVVDTLIVWTSILRLSSPRCFSTRKTFYLHKMENTCQTHRRPYKRPYKRPYSVSTPSLQRPYKRPTNQRTR